MNRSAVPAPSSSPVINADVAAILAQDLPWDALNGARVLITGASGMLPSYAYYTLLGLNDAAGAGIEILSLVRNEDKARRILGDSLTRADVQLVGQDVSAPLTVDGPIDIVIHGASAARPSLHASDPVSTIKANLAGTMNLLDECVNRGSRLFCQMSSSEVYGTVSPANGLITEDDYGPLDILNPRACYSEGKRAAETLAAVYHQQHGLPFMNARFGHIYGPGLALDDGRVQADFARDVMTGNDITLLSAGTAIRTYTYVADAMAGLWTAALKGESGAYNISDPSGLIAIRDLAQVFVDSRPTKNMQRRFASVDDANATVAYNAAVNLGLDSSKLQALGWTPQFPLAEGVDRFISHLEYTHA